MDHRDEESLTGDLDQQVPHEFTFNNRTLRQIMKKDITIEEKEKQAKKAFDHQVRNYIASKQREWNLAIKAEQAKNTTIKSKNHTLLQSEQHDNSDNSTGTEATGNRVEDHES